MDRALGAALDRGEHVRVIAMSMHLSEDSVKWRVKHLGRSLRDGWRSRQEVAAVLGVSRRAVDRWARAGQLRVTRHGTRWTRVADEDLRSFVAAHAGVLFDARAVTDATLRPLAQTARLVAGRRGPAL